ncbi:hypothetical protein [Rhodococcus koreensis]|jgi:hypothetical protein|uniref:hypothetical protein n=1 Tax=Rhodococcus koreensis TaxID=99653 RepID=UPI00197D24EB|nr:hypothetical protein [Rhodococcus koreensis]QSE84082.1 hypothetical protein JWS14_35535 [Rhodococcus koreensis]
MPGRDDPWTIEVNEAVRQYRRRTRLKLSPSKRRRDERENANDRRMLERREQARRDMAGTIAWLQSMNDDE